MTIFVFLLLHAGHQRGIHTAELGAPLIERGAADAMLAAQLRNWRSALGLLEDGNDLAIGKTGRLHAEFPKNLNLKNSTFKRDHLVGGITGPDVSRCRFIGFTSNPAAYFSATDFLCLPSYREGFPISILEAAAAGIPTIGSRIYGISDAIIEGETGMMFEARNINTLAESIIRLTEDEPLRRR